MARVKDMDPGLLTPAPKKTAVVSPTPKSKDAMHNKDAKPVDPAGGKYVWIDTPAGGMWSLHQLPPATGGTSGSGNGSNLPTRKAVSTNTIERNGHQIVVTTYDDTTTSEMDYGVSAANASQQQNWLSVGKGLLEQYGVGSLWNDYSNLITNQGYDSSTAMLAMQSTKSWQDRFSANQARLKMGLPVLDPATYLATEESYKDVLISAGVDKSIYNDNTKLGDLMAKDVSPLEMKQRLDAARTELNNKDPFVLQQLKDRFGMTEGDMVLHMLDPNVAAPVIAQKVQSALIGAEAARQNFQTSQSQADALAAQGITQSQAAQGFSQINQDGQFMQNLPGSETGSLNQQDLIDATFSNNADATAKLNRVRGARVGVFQEGGNMAATGQGITGLGSANTL